MVAAVALLRGVNVGGQAKVPMAELRQVAEEVGLGDVRTYVQSGNVAFTVPAKKALSAVPDTLRTAISTRFGVDVDVLVRTGDQLATLADRNPFLDDESRPTMLHVVFLAGTPDRSRIAGLDPDRAPGDRFVVDGDEIFVHYPDGSGRSKLTLDYFERTLAVRGTARNWNTVTRLLEMTGG